jgi:hypothetical protein
VTSDQPAPRLPSSLKLLPSEVGEAFTFQVQLAKASRLWERGDAATERPGYSANRVGAIRPKRQAGAYYNSQAINALGGARLHRHAKHCGQGKTPSVE